MTSLFSDSAKQTDLEKLGVKFTQGGAHISRTMMLAELEMLLQCVPEGAPVQTYVEAVLERNVLSKTTESTRQKTLRHLKELYGIDERVPLFRLLRKMYAVDASALPLLAVQVAWARDTLFRATSEPIWDAGEGELVETNMLGKALSDEFPGHYSDVTKIARNAGSSWTQSGHLVGRSKKLRHRVNPAPAAVTLALFLANASGFHGAAVFDNPWCRLLDLPPDRARSMGLAAHRASLLNLRGIDDVVEISFPLLRDLVPYPL